jgi:hypothetical protein
MAHHRRTRPRTKTYGNPARIWSTPAHWSITFNVRPKRRHNTRMELAVMRGEDPDELAWPLGNHKPHQYYW